MSLGLKLQLVLTFLAKIAIIEPGAFKTLGELLSKECKGKGRLETLSSSTHEGEERLE